MIRPCDQCGGEGGWQHSVTLMGHAPGCDGGRMCDRTCPVPVDGGYVTEHCPRCADMPRLPHSAFQAFVPHNEEAREWRCLVGSNYLDTCVSHPLGKPLVWPGKFEEPPTGRHVGCGWFPVFGVMLGHNPEPDWFLAKQDRKPDPDTVMRWCFEHDSVMDDDDTVAMLEACQKVVMERLLRVINLAPCVIGWVERPTRLEEVK